MAKSLPPVSTKCTSVYFSKEEIEYLEWLKSQIGISSSNKFMRVLINFFMEDEDKAVEFCKYAMEYSKINDLVRVKYKPEDEKTKQFRDLFMQKYNIPLNEALSILLENKVIKP